MLQSVAFAQAVQGIGTFAKFTVHQRSSSCQSLGSVFELAERLKLDHLICTFWGAKVC